MPTRDCRRKAFTLTETAIVLGIVGTVLAAVWLVAGTVWNNYKVYRLQQQIMTVVKNVRDSYGPSGRRLPGDGDMSASAYSDGLIPSNMASGANFFHALGGPFFLVSRGSAGDFRLRLQGVAKDNCIKTLMGFPVLASELAVTKLGVVGMATNEVAVTITNIATPGSPDVLPFKNSTAVAWCSSATNEVYIDFRFHN